VIRHWPTTRADRQVTLVTYLDHKWSPDGELDGYAQYRESVNLLVGALRLCDHDASAFDVGPTPALLAEKLNPDVTVFNYVERVNSQRGSQPWYVADVARTTGARYIGPSARTLALVTDKAGSKAACAGVLNTPPSVVVRELPFDCAAAIEDLRLPAIVKPNYEAGSRGISDDVVVDSIPALRRAVVEQLRRYPLGVLVEEFIDGEDVTVGFVEIGGECVCLPPVLYRPEALRESQRRMYDYTAKNALDYREAQRAGRHAECPAPLPTGVVAELESATRSAAAALGVRGFGRADFRLSHGTQVHFLEMNALPDIDLTAGFAIASQVAGVSLDTVVRAVVDSYGERTGAAALGGAGGDAGS
jgi:D-alanine-D-alanine ligase